MRGRFRSLEMPTSAWLKKEGGERGWASRPVQRKAYRRQRQGQAHATIEDRHLFSRTPHLRRSVPHTQLIMASRYGSPPNFSLTKSSVLKPAPGRILCNAVPHATLTTSPNSPLHTAVILFKVMFFQLPFSCRAATKRSLKKSLIVEGG